MRFEEIFDRFIFLRVMIFPMPIEDFSATVNGEWVYFWHDKKTHRMTIHPDKHPDTDVSLERGRAIITFLRHLGIGNQPGHPKV